ARCLPRGATEMLIEEPAVALQRDQWLLIDTAADPEADPPVRQIVKLVEVGDPAQDPLFPARVVRIVWRAEDALEADHHLEHTRIAANIVPATQGRLAVDRFVVARGSGTPSPVTPRALVRTGPTRTPQILHTLREGPLAWLATATATATAATPTDSPDDKPE